MLKEPSTNNHYRNIISEIDTEPGMKIFTAGKELRVGRKEKMAQRRKVLLAKSDWLKLNQVL